MKILGLNVPPELQNIFKDLVSIDSTGALAGEKASTRRKVRLSTKKKRNPTDKWQWVAEQVYEQIKGLPGIDTGKSFISEERDRLKDGIYAPEYWFPANKTTSTFLSNTPSNTIDTAPPPYAFRDPDMLPSIVTYGDGASAAAPMKFTGEVVGNEWHDTSWTWRKSVFELMGKSGGSNNLPLIWTSQGTVSATSTQRGSRPMFSLVMKAWLSSAENNISDTLQAPTKPHTSIYWNYEIKDWTGESYSAAENRSAAYVLQGRAENLDAGDTKKVTVLTAPRAMFGLGWNNNENVTTSYTDQEQLHQLMPCITEPSIPPLNCNIEWQKGYDYNWTYHYENDYSDYVWPSKVIKKWVAFIKSQLPPLYLLARIDGQNKVTLSASPEHLSGNWYVIGTGSYTTRIVMNPGTTHVNVIANTSIYANYEQNEILPAGDINFSFEGC